VLQLLRPTPSLPAGHSYCAPSFLLVARVPLRPSFGNAALLRLIGNGLRLLGGHRDRTIKLALPLQRQPGGGPKMAGMSVGFLGESERETGILVCCLLTMTWAILS